MQTRVLVALVLAVASAVRSAAGADETPFELAEALQKKYDTVRDFSADFVHTYRGGVLRKELIDTRTTPTPW